VIGINLRDVLVQVPYGEEDVVDVGVEKIVQGTHRN